LRKAFSRNKKRHLIVRIPLFPGQEF
jgi:hypothetical protein